MKHKLLASLFILGSLAAVSPAKADTVNLGFDAKTAPNTVKIEIPAPLETTRAQIGVVRGRITVDLADPSKTVGTIEADLSDIQSHSFDDPNKNKTQTEHMHNWFEIGGDVSADVREKNRWAKFVINKILKVDAVPNSKKYVIQAQGDFTVHGVTKPKTVDLEVTVDDAKKPVSIVTKTPFVVSLKDHDIKPRDTTGKFLDGALKVVGLKLSDDAQVTLDLKPIPSK